MIAVPLTPMGTIFVLVGHWYALVVDITGGWPRSELQYFT